MFAKDGFMNGNAFVRVLQIFEHDDLVALETSHILMRGVAVWAQEVCTVGTAGDRLLHGLAGGANNRGALDCRHVKDVGEHVVAGQRGRALGPDDRLLLAIRTREHRPTAWFG